ncbi:MAG: hypothetical protein MUO92_02520 [Dehalococcoidales bacterium]|nr:hypothetical protein [Dehalococcoidales bacterium]
MEIPFSIPVTGVIRLEGDRVIITVNRTETAVNVPFPAMSRRFTKLESGQSMDSVILDAARTYV